MPVYNCRQFLEESVNSILNQTYRDFEFIIVDGSSDDGTYEFLNSLSDTRINLIREHIRSGITSSLNHGLQVAKGEYIARMDADDISFPHRFERQIQYLDDHPEIGVLGTGIQIIDIQGNFLEKLQFPAQNNLLRWFMCFYDPIINPTVMMRKDIVLQAGGYDMEMRKCEDYNLWQRLFAITQFSNLQDILFSLRKHESNLSTVNPLEEMSFSIQVSRTMISGILKKVVPLSVVQYIWRNGERSASNASVSAELIYELYKAFVSKYNVSNSEKGIIRKDAAGRIYALGRPWLKNIIIWKLLIKAFYIDPSLFMKIVKRYFFQNTSIT
jgi:glycosyltransferase involved in cell wall biosynthesis